MISPYEYQSKMLDEILTEFTTHNKVLAQLMTSGGKTVIFSFLCKWWIENHKSNILILAHREELILQAESELSGIGIGSEPVLSTTKPKHHSRVYISMIQTASNRLNKNPYFFPNVGLVITDEAHWLIFQKVFCYFEKAKILGCTATPCVMKRVTFWKCKYCRSIHEFETICCDEDTEEWSRPYTMSQIYDNIVIGPDADFLIEKGSIVREISCIKHYTNDSNLRTDIDGEFTAQSAEAEYGNENAAFNVLLNYKELCYGKKTLIFNPSAKANLLIYEKFLADGFKNVRMFDSVNKEQSGSRVSLLEWFAVTPNAILLNVGVFTTGFNSREVEAIIVNRPIGSLSLYLQIGGRGMRSSNLIYKDGFIFVDGGGNIERFGELSTPRDWRKIFFNGYGKEKAKKQNAMDIHDCPACGALYPKSEPECPECGYIIPIPKAKSHEQEESNEVMKPIRAVPPPNSEKIYQYALKNGGDLNIAWQILIVYVCDMFSYYRVSADLFKRTIENGNFEKRILALITPSYFSLKGKKDLNSGTQRTRKYFVEKIKTKLTLKYEKISGE
jgi:superfamily II DNA or RNA helicase